MDYDRERGPPAQEQRDFPQDDITAKRGAFAEAIAEIRAVVADACDLLEAERDYFKTRLDFTKKQIFKLAVMAVSAVICALLFALALVVGTLLTLAALIGPLLATIIVVCALVIVTGLLALGCRRAVRDMKLKR